MKKNYYNKLGAIMLTGMTAGMSSDALAAPNNFGKIAQNITSSIENLPGLLAALSYLFGILLGVLGVLKIKDHVENPSQTPLKDGAMRLAAGGALFALPIIYEAMTLTLDQNDSGAGATTAKLSKVGFTFAAP